ncbi:transcription initiation protein [Chitinophaga oryzae]|uniref:Transcription initiation protein n=1 Tax=Chitinophaga oryzae TaxID=2725414 RepID=A0AAE6ZF30_9BACT|nr:YciI family protein [Chitinophaga oryzae]QJB31790.1 transcription initiation protein [Chitinophaga oryzae]QJB38274.1 transcription initiation protein [Chitinophaga oryzae]
MKNFLFLFRSDFSSTAKRSPEEMQNNTKMWMDWIGGIAAQNKLADRGNRLEQTGKVVRPNNVVTDGPFTEIKETLGGYTVVQASSLEEAAELAQGCPILAFGGNVEIREISVL